MATPDRTKLKQITLSGFKSFDNREHLIKFGDLTVIIGANGVGKSNVVSFFKMIGYMMTEALRTYIGEQGFASSISHYGANTTPLIKAKLEFENATFYDCYEFSLVHAAGDSLIFTHETVTFHNRNRGPKPGIVTLPPGLQESGLKNYHDPKFSTSVNTVYNLLKNCNVYHFHDTSSTAKIRNSGYINDNLFLRSDAGNMAAYLYALQQNKDSKKYYEKIIRHIRNVIPQFGDFVLRPSNRNEEYILLDWKEMDSSYLFGAHQLSDGSLRYMALATLLLQPPEKLPTVVILDEPELGLHPSAISELGGMIKSASQHCQIVIATQSPGLLDEFELNQIVVMERENKSSIFREFSESELQNWLNDYSLSELWEKNVIGGQP